MSDIQLLDFFFGTEGNDYTRRVLTDTMNETGRGVTYLTFNIFNVIVDRDRDLVTLQEDFAPCREAEYSFDEFRNGLAVAAEVKERPDDEHPCAEDE